MIQSKPAAPVQSSVKAKPKRDWSGHSNVKYCTLFVKNEGTLQQHFVVDVKVKGELVSSVKISRSVNDLLWYLNKNGVNQNDGLDALDILDSHGHNVIEFGMYGTPLGSRYEGTVQ